MGHAGEARRAVNRWIETWFNPGRLHTTNGFRSPAHTRRRLVPSRPHHRTQSREAHCPINRGNSSELILGRRDGLRLMRLRLVVRGVGQAMQAEVDEAHFHPQAGLLW